MKSSELMRGGQNASTQPPEKRPPFCTITTICTARICAEKTTVYTGNTRYKCWFDAFICISHFRHGPRSYAISNQAVRPWALCRISTSIAWGMLEVNPRRNNWRQQFPTAWRARSCSSVFDIRIWRHASHCSHGVWQELDTSSLYYIDW